MSSGTTSIRMRAFVVVLVVLIVILFLYSVLDLSGMAVQLTNSLAVSSLPHFVTNGSSSFFRQLTDNLRKSSTRKEARVVCMVFTTPGQWRNRARAVRNTWAKRCPIHVFFYSKSAAVANHEIANATDAVGLDVPEGRSHLTGKTMTALRYSLRRFGNVSDWFFKADDDTYVIWENLEYLLSLYDSTSPAYVGRLIRNYIPNGYTSGGAGYLISKPAVTLMINKGSKQCAQDGAIEDLDIGKCLQKFGVFPNNTIGADGRLLMHSDNPIYLLDGNTHFARYYYFSVDNVQVGNIAVNNSDHVMSRKTVSFHYVTPGQMYMFDFLLYRLLRYPSSLVSTMRSGVQTPNRSR